MSSSPSVSPVTEKVTRTRTVSPAEIAKENSASMPECWEYLENLKPEQWTEHIVYLYREEPKASTYAGGPPAYLDKFVGSIEVRPGVSVPMDDAGNIQQAIKDKFGGRVFRMIVKRGRERITETRFTNEAPPKYPDVNPSYQNNPLPGAATDASVASKAIDAMAAQQPDAMRLAMDILTKTSEMVMRRTDTPPAQGNLLNDTIIQALIARALAPPPDPFAMFVRFKEVMGGPATNGVNETLQLINTLKESGIVGGGSGKSTLIDLGREVIPAVAASARDALREWRMGVEAQVKGVEMAQRINSQPQSAVPAVPQQIAPAVPAAAAPPETETQNAPSGEPPFDWLAIKIVEILREPTYTVDEAVDETLSFLYRSHGAVVPMLLNPPAIDAQLPPGEQGLMLMFQHHPVLKQIPINARLVEFIKLFIVEAKKAEADRAPKPGPKPVPAAPAALPSA